MKKITKEVLELYVEMVATLTESSVEATERMLELYYQIRRSYEEGQQAERAPKTERAGLPVAKKPEKSAKAEQKEPSPSAKAAAFKRETLERMRKAMKEKGMSYPKISEASGLEEARLIRMMEGKPEPVEAYRRVAAGLDKLKG